MALNQDNTDQATVASGGLYPYRCVKFNSSGELAYAGVGDQCIGTVQRGKYVNSGDYAYAAADLGTFYRKTGTHFVEAGGTFAIGDYLKMGANGRPVVEASASVVTVDTVAQARTAGTVGAVAEVEFL